MIPSAELARLAYRLGVGDRVIEKDYVLSWLLVAVAESGLRHALAFSGHHAARVHPGGNPHREAVCPDGTNRASRPV
jgi:hypothetical protein